MSDEANVWQVWKYQLNPGVTRLQMPMDAKVLHVEVQHGQPQLWALVQPTNEIRDRDFFVVGTGHPFQEYLQPSHVGTFMLEGGALVFHVFESMDARIESAMEYSPLERELSDLLNYHSAENGSDTPDFILATYMLDCLAAFERATKARTTWHAGTNPPQPTAENGPSTTTPEEG